MPSVRVILVIVIIIPLACLASVRLSCSAAAAAPAERRVALVIGNAAYGSVARLANPVADARAVAEALRRAGFTDVAEGYDLTRPQFDAALKRFGDAAAGADWALLYFAGHGVSIGGETYLLPVDAELARADHVDDEGVTLARLRAKAAGATSLRMVILDSCRNNPFIARMKTDGPGKRALNPRGLARPAEPEGGELIAYATRENDVADDGNGEHSPFTAAFLAQIEEPGIEVNFFFRAVRSAVMRATGNAQAPAIYESLPDRPFYFRPPLASLPAAQAPGPQPLPSAAPGLSESARVEHLRPSPFRSDDPQSAPTAPDAPPRRDAPDVVSALAAPTYEDSAQQLLRTFEGHSAPVTAAALSPDGRTAVSGSADRTLKLWDLASGREIRSFTGHTVPVTGAAFSPDGRRIVSGAGLFSGPGELKLWDADSGRLLHSFEGPRLPVTAIALSPDGRTVLSLHGDPLRRSEAALWEVETGRRIGVIPRQASALTAAAFSPDGRAALFGRGFSLREAFDRSPYLRLADVATGDEIAAFAGHGEAVNAVAFSPDGRRALSGGADGAVKLWDIATGKELLTFSGHREAVEAVAFSPDGGLALSGGGGSGEAAELKLWDVASGRERRSFEGHSDVVKAVAFTPDGRRALSASADRTLKLWDLSKLWDLGAWSARRDVRR